MPTQDTSLSLLARACDHRNTAAWNQLAQIYSPLLGNWLQKLGVQSADIEDLVQDVLLVLSREITNFEHNGRPGAFRNWVRKILVNRTRDFWRSRKYRAAAVGGSDWAAKLEALAEENSKTEREWELEHDRRVIEALLTILRPRYSPATWEAFYRQVFLGEPAASVASALGMSISSVYVARSRILHALRQEVAGLVID